MSNERAKHAWSQTAALLALQANINRDPKKRSRPYSPDDFNPLADRRTRSRSGIRVCRANREILRSLLKD